MGSLLMFAQICLTKYIITVMRVECSNEMFRTVENVIKVVNGNVRQKCFYLSYNAANVCECIIFCMDTNLKHSNKTDHCHCYFIKFTSRFSQANYGLCVSNETWYGKFSAGFQQ